MLGYFPAGIRVRGSDIEREHLLGSFGIIGRGRCLREDSPGAGLLIGASVRASSISNAIVFKIDRAAYAKRRSASCQR